MWDRVTEWMGSGHFVSIGNTNDASYGEERCFQMAQTNPAAAMLTADNFGYFAM